MPNWKKLVTSGSDAYLNSLNVTYGVTGSLYGTSSWAKSSSFALTASYFAGTVDDLGVNPLVVVVATTTALPNSPVYGNGVLGVGAFLSGSVNGALGNIDSTSLNVFDRILVKNQTSQLQNGVYEVTQTGSAVARYILTRTVDSDETAEFDPQVVIPSSGSVNRGLLFAQNTDNPIVGTSNITYTQTTTTTYVTQGTTGTQTLYNIPWWTSTARQLSRGVSNLQYNSVTNTLRVTGSIIATSVTSSLFGTASWARNAQTSSYVLNAVSSSFSQTASYLNTLNQNLIFNGNLTLNGTASISYLNVIYETASVIYSSGSNQFGDATTDIQTLIGTTIVSGGLQVTGSVNANSFTGSLFGTASWAQNAISASYALSSSFAISASYSDNALSSSYSSTASYYGGSVESASYAHTASYVNTLYQDVFLTGSLFVSNSLNTFNKSLIDDSNVTSVRWNQRALGDATNTLSIDWQNRKAFDSSQLDSIDWRNRWLYNSAGIVLLDWESSTAYDVYTTNSIDWTNRELYDQNTQIALNWQGRTLYDQNSNFSADWAQRLLYNNAGIFTLDWQSTRAYDGSSLLSIDWQTRYLYDTSVAGAVALDYGNRLLLDSTQTPSIYWGSRALYNSTSTTYLSWANNIIINGSGSATPLFTIQGSLGNLFSVTDSLSGSLFSVNDISGLPILEVFSDNNTLIGDYQAPMLVTTKKIAMTNSGSFTVFNLPTSSYDTAFFEYSIKSGSNARAGTIMAIQSGIDVNFTETTTTDFGDTSGVTFSVGVSGSYIILSGSAATGSWTIKSIIRGL